MIQQIYDSHYEGAKQAADFVLQWKSLENHLPADSYTDALKRLEYQAGHAIVWRDAISDWFFKTSGIPDAKGRVGNHPGRIEAEAMQLKNYTPMNIIPGRMLRVGRELMRGHLACEASFVFNALRWSV